MAVIVTHLGKRTLICVNLSCCRNREHNCQQQCLFYLILLKNDVRNSLRDRDYFQMKTSQWAFINMRISSIASEGCGLRLGVCLRGNACLTGRGVLQMAAGLS